MTSKVENVGQKHIYTSFDHQPHLTVTEWKAQDCGILKPAKDTSMLAF